MKYSLPVCIVLLCLLLVSTVLGQVPRTVSYQGVLTDSLGYPKPDSTYELAFRLFSSEDGTGLLWMEQKSLEVRRGLFHTVLGDMIPFPDSMRFDTPYWLGVQLASQSAITKPFPLTAAGYSLYSLRSDTAMVAKTSPVQAFVDSARIAGSVPALSSLEVTGSAHIGDTIMAGNPSSTGSIYLYRSGSSFPIVLLEDFYSMGGRITALDEDAVVTGQLRPSSAGIGGTLELYSNQSGRLGFFATGNPNGGQQGYMAVYGSADTALFDMSRHGDDAVRLPDNAIASPEIMDETGIAQNKSTSAIEVGSSGVTLLIMGTLTAPAAGYIVAEADAWALIRGDTIGTIRTGIEQGASDMPTSGAFNLVGSANEVVPVYAERYASISLRRTFLADSAGSYTFYMVADRYTYAGGDAFVYYPRLQMTYHPTSYGNVIDTFPGRTSVK